LAPQGDINIVARKVDIIEARETSRTETETKFRQSGLTVSLSGGMLDTLQSTTRAVQGATRGGSNRNQALNALMAYGKGSDLIEQGKAVTNAYQNNGVMGNTGANGQTNPGAAAASGIKISISAGSSSSQSNTRTETNTAAGSTVKAGGDIQIYATEGDLTVQGSKIQGERNINLSAANNLQLLASADTETQRSTNKSSSTSVGVSFGVGAGSAGFSLDIAASRGKGQANSDSTTWNNTQVQAGERLTLNSGGDTTLKGAVAKGEQIVVNVGTSGKGNLVVESLQDTATSNASQTTTGVSVSIPIGAGSGSASFSQAKQRSNGNYQSVNEQSGLEAGDGGFQVNVQGNTTLIGAVITSSDAAVDAGKNRLNTQTLTVSELQNRMNASASSSGISVGSNMLSGKYEAAKGIAGNAMNRGKAEQNDASTTRSAMSGAQVTVGSQTTDTRQASLIDSNGKVVSSDTQKTHRALGKADVVGLQQQAQQKQSDNMLLLNTVTALADDGLKKMSKPQLRQVFCLSEPCSNDQKTNTVKIAGVAEQLMKDNPGLSADQATTLAIAKIAGVGGDASKADPNLSGSDPNREIKILVDDKEIRVRNIQTLPLTPEELAALPNDQKINSTVFSNGILNNEQRAAELAIQQTPRLDPNDPAQRQQIESTGSVLPGNTYLVHTDKSNNAIGELMVAGVEKLAELFGMATPAAELKAQAIRLLSTNTTTGQTDNPVTSVGHSRGTMTQVNQLRTLADQGFYNSNLQVIANNPAAFESNLRQAGSQVTSPNNISIWAPKNDPVATFVGFYPGDWGASLQAFPSVFATSYSVHSSPGSGAVGSQNTDVNRPFSYNNLNIDQLNQTRQPQTNAVIQQVMSQPKPIVFVPSTDPTTKLQEQMRRDSNTQMNNLLRPPVVPSTPIPASPSPNTRLESLNQFKQGGQ
jgi:filamentous hemagglutinin